MAAQVGAGREVARNNRRTQMGAQLAGPCVRLIVNQQHRSFTPHDARTSARRQPRYRLDQVIISGNSGKSRADLHLGQPVKPCHVIQSPTASTPVIQTLKNFVSPRPL